mgnify:CR=1 FL=1
MIKYWTKAYTQDNHEAITDSVDQQHDENAKIFEFNPKILDGGKNKNK